jgi:hypothetical protein
MTLPASGTISLNDIRVELQQASTNVSLGAMSNLVGFVDPDAVSDFYGYSYPLYNTFSIVNSAYDTPEDACDEPDEDNLTLYFAGSGGTPACPSTSVILYTNTALTNAFNGSEAYWRSQQCGSSYYILNTGFIEGIFDC